ncbi:MAG TPA: hypothetical protein VFN19_08080, partial [Candidatus Nanopelagicales bacterium]|nr:hypothetical protein [Candidatus Nanopelagicales bacterium]
MAGDRVGDEAAPGLHAGGELTSDRGRDRLPIEQAGMVDQALQGGQVDDQVPLQRRDGRLVRVWVVGVGTEDGGGEGIGPARPDPR